MPIAKEKYSKFTFAFTIFNFDWTN